MLIMWYALLAMLLAATSNDATITLPEITPRREVDLTAQWVAAHIEPSVQSLGLSQTSQDRVGLVQ